VRRYFFHLKSPDGLEVDEIGLDLADEGAAYKAALGVMAELAGELMQDGHSPLECSFWITDDNGDKVIEAPFPDLLNGAHKLVPAIRRANGARPPNFRSGRANRDLADTIFRQQFETSPMAHLILTPDLTIVAANASYRTMMGSPLDQMVGRFLFDAFPDNAEAPSTTDRRSVTDSFHRALIRGRPETLALIRYDIAGADGVLRERYWRTEASPIRDEDGSTIGLDIKAAELTGHMRDLAKWRRRHRRGR
jgi:PAS domain-containing protein